MNMRTFLAIHLLFVSCISFTATKEENEATKTQKITTKDLAEHAAHWVKNLPQLSPEEMSLLCNYLYLESLSYSHQFITQKTIISIHTASALMNKQLPINEDEAKKIAAKAAQELTQFQNELLPARTTLAQSCQHCMNGIEQSEHTTLKKVIIGYQQYTRAVVAQFIKQDKANIDKILTNCKATLDNHLKVAAECTKTLNDILNDENPYVKEGMDRNVADMDVAMAAADTALGSMNDATLACSNAKSMSGDLLSISAIINTIFYNTIHQALKDNQDETMFPVYRMFDENGLIEEDIRNEELPLIDGKSAKPKKKR